MLLAPYAVSDATSRGRKFDENKPSDGRTEFQRDRDRVIHSSAYRRLQGKTQVFTLASVRFGHQDQEFRFSDHLRNRLTHSQEVAQVSRTLARHFKLNEDLVETLALAHDFGHPPFGHTGQDVLHDCMKKYGGFEHNIQSLRICDHLERIDPRFRGLNLMFETREGLIKHCSVNNAKTLGDAAARILKKEQATLEGQVTDLGDAIAYTCHDIDDGVRSGLITPQTMMEVPIFKRTWEAVSSKYPGIDEDMQLKLTIKDMLGLFIRGVVSESTERIARANLSCPQDVRTAGKLIVLPQELYQQHLALKSHLMETLYMHQDVARVREDAHNVLTALFTAYMDMPELIPAPARQGLDVNSDETQVARMVVDYISGMTDSFAYQASRNLTRDEPGMILLG